MLVFFGVGCSYVAPLEGKEATSEICNGNGNMGWELRSGNTAARVGS